MPRAAGNQLVNRQETGTYQGKIHQRHEGLLKKVEHEADASLVKVVGAPAEAPIDNIRVAGDVVLLSELVHDPQNANEHNDRNLAAIRDSLMLYGQLKPLVVRRESRVVIAGNGTMDAALGLGWTKLAVNYVDMTDVDAIGYGLVDNKSAKLSSWNFKVVAALDKLLLDNNHPTIGWTIDELEVLRQADWSPPPVTEGGDSFGGEAESVKVTFDEARWLIIQPAIDQLNSDLFIEDGTSRDAVDEAEAIQMICSQWLEAALERIALANQGAA